MTIEGVSTSTAGFVGPTRRGPTARAKRPVRVLTSYGEFERVYGGSEPLRGGALNYVAHAARAFFEQGGRRLYVARTPANTAEAYSLALAKLEAVDEVSTLAAPGSAMVPLPLRTSIVSALIEHAERLKRFAVVDSGPALSAAGVRDQRAGLDSAHAALYYPWVVVRDPTNGVTELVLPPSGFMCGIYARVDDSRGVHKAPANEVVRGAVRFERTVTAVEQDVLNPQGINCLRFFQGRGNLVWGARTLSSNPEWRYVNVRRYLNYLESSLDHGLRWSAFEPNAAPLWTRVRAAVEDFLLGEWRNAALLGIKPEEAFFVQCDRSTITEADLASGKLICLIGVAMLRPAEFVYLRIAQQTAG